LVEKKLIAELKIRERVLGIHEAKMLTNLESAEEIGLPMNFNVTKLKERTKPFAL
jgi:hypothetical protein